MRCWRATAVIIIVLAVLAIVLVSQGFIGDPAAAYKHANLLVASVPSFASVPSQDADSLGSSGNQAAWALKRFEEECHDRLSVMFAPRHVSRSHVDAPIGKQALMYEPRTVCITRSVNIYRYNSTAEMPSRRFIEALRRNPGTKLDFKSKNATFSGNRLELFRELDRDLSLRQVTWHHTVGLLMTTRIDQHAHHFIMDEAMQALSLLETENDLRRHSRYEPVRVSDTVLNVVARDDDDRPMWRVTRDMIPPLLMSSPSSTFVNFDSNGSEDNHTHCYCQAIVLHGHYNHERQRALSRRPCGRSDEYSGCSIMRDIRHRLVRHFNVTPFGTRVSLYSFQSLGLWEQVVNVSQPRLLIGLRPKRNMADVDTISSIAESLGYAVQRIVFEQHPPRTQFVAMRSADVFIAIHGAAFTWMMFLNTLGANSECRSVIELLTSLPTRFIHFYVVQSKLSNVTLFRVPMLRQEFHHLPKRELKRIAHISKVRNPFVAQNKNQTLYYDIEKVRKALADARELHRQCVT